MKNGGSRADVWGCAVGRADLYPRAKAEARTADGIVFGSKREMLRYHDLKLLEKAGEIRELKWQTKFTFVVNGHVVGSFKSDFTYLDESSAVVVEDVKAWRLTPKTRKKVPVLNREYRIKKNLMRALFNLEVREV